MYNHPDFRVAGKTFATLVCPDKAWAMAKLTPEQQHYFSKDEPEVFPSGKRRLGTPRRHARKPESRQEEYSAQSHSSRPAQCRPKTFEERERLIQDPTRKQSANQ
ncbi:MAG: hypothetical protein WCA27_08585 [Candidatus Sulfotelmatobacter sp.]